MYGWNAKQKQDQEEMRLPWIAFRVQLYIFFHTLHVFFNSSIHMVWTQKLMYAKSLQSQSVRDSKLYVIIYVLESRGCLSQSS